MADFAKGLTQALLGGTAEMGRGMQERQKTALADKRATALQNLKAKQAESIQTRKEEEGVRTREAAAERSRLDREARAETARKEAEAKKLATEEERTFQAEESQKERESRERIAGMKDQDETLEFDELGAQADAYAEERVDEQAGWFETDAESFKEFGGSRAKAKEFYRKEFMQGRDTSGLTTKHPVRKEPTSKKSYTPVQTRLIDAVRTKYPEATEEQILTALKDDPRYSKHFQ